MPEQPQFVQELTDAVNADASSDGLPTHIAVGVILGAALLVLVGLNLGR